MLELIANERVATSLVGTDSLVTGWQPDNT